MATRRKRSRRAPVRWIGPLAAVPVLTALLYLLLMTDSFSLREVRVLGGAGLPIDSLRMVTATLVGENIFTAPLGRIRRELMRFPAVKEVTFRKRPFNRLDCYLKEREPVVLVTLDRPPHGAFLEVDSDGVIIPRRSGAGDVDLPIISGIGPDEIHTASGGRKVRDALEVLCLFRSFGFSPAGRLSEIHFEDDELMVILTGTGSTVRVGRGMYRRKIRKLRTVYAALDEQERFPDVIDLRFEHQVIVR